MKHTLFSLAFAIILSAPVSVSAAALTPPQVNAIIGLLLAFGVDQPTIDSVYTALTNTPIGAKTAPTAPMVPETAHAPILTQTASVEAPASSTPAYIALWADKTDVMGANCEPVRVTIEIVDQYGVPMPDQEVVLTTLQGTEKEKTTRTNEDEGKHATARFSYKALTTNTREVLQFSSGALSESFTLTTRDGLNHAKLLKSGSDWYEASGGFRVDKDNLLCR